MKFNNKNQNIKAQLCILIIVNCLPLYLSSGMKFLECTESKIENENCTISGINDVFAYRVPIHIPLSFTRSKKHIICLNSKPDFFPGIIFDTFTRTEKFTAKDCYISKLANQPFSKAGYLRELYMPHNSIRFLVNNIFKGAPRLQVIDLSYNKIDTVNENVFGFMRYLKHLNLSHNHLWGLNLVLQVNGPLQLAASHNNIMSLSIKSERYIPRSMNLDIDVRHNRISRVDIPNIPVNSIQLDYNNLQQVSSVARIKRLVRYSLFNNPIFVPEFIREPYTPRTKLPKALYVQTVDRGIEPVVGIAPSNCTGGFELLYCLNGGVCYNFNIDQNIILLTCICQEPFFGERCEEKALYGSYSRRTRPLGGYPGV